MENQHRDLTQQIHNVTVIRSEYLKNIFTKPMLFPFRNEWQKQI